MDGTSTSLPYPQRRGTGGGGVEKRIRCIAVSISGELDYGRVVLPAFVHQQAIDQRQEWPALFKATFAVIADAQIDALPRAPD